MTTERNYLCNLCRGPIRQYLAAECQNGELAGVGCYFSGSAHRFVHMRDAEHHLCQACILHVVANARKIGLVADTGAGER